MQSRCLLKPESPIQGESSMADTHHRSFLCLNIWSPLISSPIIIRPVFCIDGIWVVDTKRESSFQATIAFHNFFPSSTYIFPKYENNILIEKHLKNRERVKKERISYLLNIWDDSNWHMVGIQYIFFCMNQSIFLNGLIST